MKKLLLCAVLVGCGQKGDVASPTPIFPLDAAGSGRVVDAGPDQAGEVPMDQVQEAMGPVKQAIEDSCASTTAFSGVTKVMITIHPDGTAAATIEQSSGMADVDACVQAQVAKAQFPASQRGQRFHYSFKFK